MDFVVLAGLWWKFGWSGGILVDFWWRVSGGFLVDFCWILWLWCVSGGILGGGFLMGF